MPTAKDNVHDYIYIQKELKTLTFLYKKSWTLCKKQDNFCHVFNTKSGTPYVMIFFMKFFKLAFIKTRFARVKSDNICPL